MFFKRGHIRLKHETILVGMVGFVVAFCVGVPIAYFLHEVYSNLTMFIFIGAFVVGCLGAALALLFTRKGKRPPIMDDLDEEEARQKLDPPMDRMSYAQLKKVRLETENLQRSIEWEHGIARYIPLLTAMIAVVGFLFGIYQFQRQEKARQGQIISEQQKERDAQERNRLARERDQVRADISQLNEFAHDKTQTVSKGAFLLEDLKMLMNTDASREQKRIVSRSLFTLITYDSDFINQPRDVEFAAIALGSWDDYTAYLKEELDRIDFLLHMHVRALRGLRDKNPGYFEAMTYHAATRQYIVPPEYEKRDEGARLYVHFLDIKDGFIQHLKLLGEESANPKAAQIKAKNERNFQAALCNEHVTRSILGTYYSDHKKCED